MSEESSPESLKKQCHSIVDTVAPWILIVPPHADVEIDGVEQEVALPQMPATVITMGSPPGPESRKFWISMLKAALADLQAADDALNPRNLN